VRNLLSMSLMWGTPFSITVFLATLLSPMTAPGATILQYQFNGSGTDAVGTGTAAVDLPMTRWDGTTWVSADNHTAAGTGVSGLPSDRAYHDPSLVLDPAFAAGTSNAHYFGGFAGNVDIAEVKTLSAITVQGWFKVAAGKPLGTDGTAQALIGNLGTSANDGGWAIRGLRTSTAGGLEFRFGELLSSLDHVSVMAPAGTYSETDEWVMFAATLDASTGAWQFFKGKAGSPVAGVASGTAGALNGGAITAPNSKFYIGNSGSESSAFLQGRAFNGSLDNMRVFDSILGLDELERFRQADLAGVPEPSTALMLLVGLAISTLRANRPLLCFHDRRST
jgi:Concanavalin A-like lectin/glucanases superfamily